MQGDFSSILQYASNGSSVALFALYIIYVEVLKPRRAAKGNSPSNGNGNGNSYPNGISPLLIEKFDRVNDSLDRLEKLGEKAADKSEQALSLCTRLEQRLDTHLNWDGRDRRSR